MRIRVYEAFYDNGHDGGSFEYTSDYRNESKGNLEDAYREMKNRHGRRHTKEYGVIITYTQLKEIIK